MKDDSRDNVPGTIYLLHFEKPIGDPSRPNCSAQHYMGWTENLESRLKHHLSGNGAAIMKTLHQRQIKWWCARVWEGATRNDERHFKNSGHFKDRLCPICSAGIEIRFNPKRGRPVAR